MVAVETPQRPVSSAGIDGTSVTVAAPPWRLDLTSRLQIEELTAARGAAPSAAAPAADRTTAAAEWDAEIDLQVRADEPAEVGLIEGIIDSVIGFLFG